MKRTFSKNPNPFGPKRFTSDVKLCLYHETICLLNLKKKNFYSLVVKLAHILQILLKLFSKNLLIYPHPSTFYTKQIAILTFERLSDCCVGYIFTLRESSQK